ncbi:hypothetical protein D5018_09015 [Parashewanella curva]|uniref:DUF3828 domain-containing protein n=1 Tax=Parashewanella curva TaxID=2338552 RepID=A0A3L8PXL9_9GAMM|nr:hypothetical protein [Parashewanella curva]RLV60044.1 hypothetical protein D5018_09015 [Parashewanella curva]
MRWISIFVVFLICACSPDKESTIFNPNNPEYAAYHFLKALYIDQSVTETQKFSGHDLKQLLKHYHIASAVQRHVLNLPLHDVQLEVQEIDIDFFRKMDGEVKIRMKMTGTRNDRPWFDTRLLAVNKENNKWLVTKIIFDQR